MQEKEFDDFIDQLIISQPNIGVLEFGNIVQGILERKPTLKESTSFLRKINLSKSGKSPTSAITPPSHSSGDVNDAEIRLLRKQVEDLQLQVLLHHAESHPNKMPKPIGITAVQMAAITDVRELYTVLQEVLYILDRLSPLLPADCMAAVQHYTKEIKLPQLAAGTPDDKEEVYYKRARDVPFPLESLSRLVEENNRLLNGSLYQESFVNVGFLPKDPRDTVRYVGNKVYLTLAGTAVGINADLADGKIYVIDLILKGKLSCGVILKSQVPHLSSCQCWSHPGACFVTREGTIYLGSSTFSYSVPYSGDEDKSNFVLLRMELDASHSKTNPTRTLHYFINSAQVSSAITHIPDGVVFAFGPTGPGLHTVEVLSLLTIPCTLADSSILYKEYKWTEK